MPIRKQKHPFENLKTPLTMEVEIVSNTPQNHLYTDLGCQERSNLIQSYLVLLCMCVYVFNKNHVEMSKYRNCSAFDPLVSANKHINWNQAFVIVTKELFILAD